ncbi:hypothetical protein AURDEDRAFT_178140 [Auricularia subglabra TFB-10046 SS5]|uniref:F-box domain-containing protein n=1 Tax=Auricularia subglabra (strain TFB-10046 / SS5) TaxID=717982 RepID=J0WKC9_AURST|nr:hypothetical protein AURDEDRAFT_178140 [Auricularia subglabra TFB-10046 SS5]
MIDVTRALSLEVLAEYLSFLTFRDVISPSRVCRFWRSAALGFPRLWSRVHLRAPLAQSAWMLRMAVSRSGRLPIDFEYRSHRWSPPSLTTGMSGSAGGPSSNPIDVSRPAPSIREFISGGPRNVIPKEFLGDSIGQLRNLELQVPRLSSR